MLLNCNALSAGRIKTANDDLKKYTKLINDMKKDLDHIFKKVRTVKSKISTQYPDAMAQVQSKVSENNLSDEEVGVIAEEHMAEPSSSQSAPRQVKTTTAPIDSTTVAYVQLRHESEASSSPASNDAIPIDRH